MATKRLPGRVETEYAKKANLAARSLAREDALAGDPFPLLRYEWPELIIRDPYELEMFATYCERKDHLDLRIDDFQVDLIKTVFGGRHTQARMGGGTGLGKGFCVGGLITNIWFSLFTGKEYSKIVMVGPTTDHLIRNMFADTATWRRKMTSHTNDCEFVDDPHVEAMVDKNDRQHWVALANTSSGEAVSGAHSPNTLYIFEEASGCPDIYYNNSTSQAKFILCVSNPRLPSGWFYEGYPKEFVNGIQTIQSPTGPMRVYAVGAIECLNVKAKRLSTMISPVCGIDIEGVSFDPGDPIPLEMKSLIKPLIPGQICYDRCESLKLTRPKDEVEWSVYGRFPRTNRLLMLFNPDWKKPAVQRHVEIASSIEAKAFGCDVGASEEGDPTCLATGDTKGLHSLTLFNEPDLTMLEGLLYAKTRELGVDLKRGMNPIAVDVIGVGNMLASRLALAGCWVIRVGNDGVLHQNKEYANRRAEVYGEFAEMINPEKTNPPWAMIDDAFLWEEIHAIEKIYKGPEQFLLIPKKRPPAQKEGKIQDNRKSIEEKIKRSPNRSDAASLLVQAVRELPEYGINDVHQFDPRMKLRRYLELVGCDDIEVLYWGGSREILSRDEFILKFGENPVPFGSLKI